MYAQEIVCGFEHVCLGDMYILFHFVSVCVCVYVCVCVCVYVCAHACMYLFLHLET